MLGTECSECGERMDYPAMRMCCSYECRQALEERWRDLFAGDGGEYVELPRVGHYPDAPGVGEWSPEEMEERIRQLTAEATPNA